MNIFLLANGLGQRFKDDGYLLPKPLIPVHGKALIFHSLDEIFKLEKIVVYVLYNEALEFYQFENLIKNRYPDKNIKFLKLNQTNGAADTLYQGLKYFKLEDSFVSIDCDVIFSVDNLIEFQNHPRNLIYYFLDKADKPLYSYIEIKNNLVFDIKEKKKISDFANCGIYGFGSSIAYRGVFDTMDKSGSEIYISSVYQKLLNHSELIYPIQVKNYHCLGIPLQLQTYCLLNSTSEKKRICFDIDNTLFQLSQTKDYKNLLPIDKNIGLLKNLHKDGHTIILYTARKMKSSNNNMGAAMQSGGKDVFDLLEKYKIPYNEIYFKPHFDYIIDDLAVNTFSDISKNIGFYYSNQESRPNNKVTFEDNKVIKETSNEGEIYWYKNIPNDIKDLFPKIYSIEGNKIIMEKIDGVSLDYLYCNEQLTEEHLELLFNELDRIHNSKPKFYDCEIDIYNNYIPKLIERSKHEYYKEIKDDKFVLKLHTKLKEYKGKNLGVFGVCHGDPVFNNIFLITKDRKSILKFIDMRGKIGDRLSIFSDQILDFAKLYQSLFCYSETFNNKEVSDAYKAKIAVKFSELFLERFSKEHLYYLLYIVASLLYSLLPFHEDANKRRKYIEDCEYLINTLG